MVRHLSRGAWLGTVLAASLVAGLLAFTALGVGGGQPPEPPLVPRPKVQLTAYAAHPPVGGAVGRSESIGLRENGGAGDPNVPALAEQVPFEPSRFKAPIAAYRRYAAGQVRRMRGETAALTAAIASGRRGPARAAWRTAFSRYLRLGAVYGAFGALDGEIDGLPGGLPKGAADPHFTGLHKLEQGLWGRAGVRSLLPAAQRLQRDTARLTQAVASAEMQPVDYAARAHEILEDAQRDFLSGTSVPWSGEGVLATASCVEATALILQTLNPLLRGQQSQVTTEAAIGRMRSTLRALRAAHGGELPTLATMSRPQRQRLNGSLSWALEQLQTIPGSLETSDPAAIPALRAR